MSEGESAKNDSPKKSEIQEAKEPEDTFEADFDSRFPLRGMVTRSTFADLSSRRRNIGYRASTSGKQVTVKSIGSWRGIAKEALQEITILRKLNNDRNSHPNIVLLLGVVTSAETNKTRLVFEYLHCDLRHLLEKGSLDLDLVKSYTKQILGAINYSYIHSVLHGNIRPDHILLTSDLRTVRICGWGTARDFIPPVPVPSGHQGTVWYRSPEILLGEECPCLPSDIWSVGLVLGEMVNGLALIPGDSAIDQIYRIFQCRGTPTELVWPGVTKLPNWANTFPEWPTLSMQGFVPRLCESGVNLLERLLELDPAKRIGPEEALRHSYIFSGPLPREKCVHPIIAENKCTVTRVPGDFYLPLEETDAALNDNENSACEEEEEEGKGEIRGNPRASAGVRSSARLAGRGSTTKSAGPVKAAKADVKKRKGKK